MSVITKPKGIKMRVVIVLHISFSGYYTKTTKQKATAGVCVVSGIPSMFMNSSEARFMFSGRSCSGMTVSACSWLLEISFMLTELVTQALTM